MNDEPIMPSKAGVKKAVFAFGRMQPPTEGHAYLIRSVIEAAGEDGDAYIFPTSTHSGPKKSKRRKTAKASASAATASAVAKANSPKTEEAKELAEDVNNPLTIDQKVHWLRIMFPEGARIINTTKQDCKMIFAAIDKLLNAGYTDISVVVGADRKEDFETMFSNVSTNAKLVSKGATLGIRVLPRPEEAISGTKVRTMAARGQITQFRRSVKTGLMTDADALELMNEVREAMGLEPIETSMEGGSGGSLSGVARANTTKRTTKRKRRTYK
jgi:hypothetical protein